MSDDKGQAAEPRRPEEELLAVRREKLKRLVELHRAAGIAFDPFRGDGWLPSQRIGEVVSRWGALSAEELETEKVRVEVAGRLTALRRFGKAGFADLRDGSGRIQAHFRKDALPAWQFDVFRRALDLGDFLGVEGTLFRTRTGELTVAVERLHFLTKALRDLPEKWHGLTDIEQRYRRRYLDLLANPESRRRFETRSRIVAVIRRFFDAKGFLEVETPMMHLFATGAAARPFRTHHNALDLDLVLRIAPELHLKRLVVGGFDRVYELGRNFRNEGISTQHNPEFTMLEFYWAYARLDDLLILTEELLGVLLAELGLGSQLIYQGEELSFATPFRRARVGELVAEATGVSEAELEDPLVAARTAVAEGLDPAEVARVLLEIWAPEDLRQLLATVDVRVDDAGKIDTELVGSVSKRAAEDAAFRERLWQAIAAAAGAGYDPRVHAGAVVALLFEGLVEERLRDPTFVTHFPIAVSPLAQRVAPPVVDADGQPIPVRVLRDRGETPPPSHLAARFELLVAGREIANGYEELNDPEDQRKRFEFQLRARRYGEEEAMEYDADYVRALEHGLPPTAGEGIGVDRLVMLLTDAPSIRDVILFPLLKPRR